MSQRCSWELTYGLIHGMTHEMTHSMVSKEEAIPRLIETFFLSPGFSRLLSSFFFCYSGSRLCHEGEAAVMIYGHGRGRGK